MHSWSVPRYYIEAYETKTHTHSQYIRFGSAGQAWQTAAAAECGGRSSRPLALQLEQTLPKNTRKASRKILAGTPRRFGPMEMRRGRWWTGSDADAIHERKK